MGKFDKFMTPLSKWFHVIAGIGMIYVLLISVADIIMNKVFKDPINWAFDSIGLVAVIAIVFAIPEVQVNHGHIEVEVLEARLSRFWRKIIGLFVNVLGIILWSIVAWRSFLYGIDILRSGEVSMTVEMPIYPFIWFQGICAIVVTLVLLLQTINIFRTAAR
jgi:TRAP-type C4-dicarboxylate transport system permease small subunit